MSNDQNKAWYRVRNNGADASWGYGTESELDAWGDLSGLTARWCGDTDAECNAHRLGNTQAKNGEGIRCFRFADAIKLLGNEKLEVGAA